MYSGLVGDTSPPPPTSAAPVLSPSGTVVTALGSTRAGAGGLARSGRIEAGSDHGADDRFRRNLIRLCGKSSDEWLSTARDDVCLASVCSKIQHHAADRLRPPEITFQAWFRSQRRPCRNRRSSFLATSATISRRGTRQPAQSVRCRQAMNFSRKGCLQDARHGLSAVVK